MTVTVAVIVRVLRNSNSGGGWHGSYSEHTRLDWCGGLGCLCLAKLQFGGSNRVASICGVKSILRCGYNDASRPLENRSSISHLSISHH